MSDGCSRILTAGGTALLMLVALTASQATAANTSGTLWYTTYNGGQNIHKVDYTWSSNVLSLSANTAIGPGVNGADGILFLPNGNLAIGGQGRRVHEVDPAGNLVTTLTVPTDSYHLSLSPGGKVLYSASIPGQPTAITLNGSGGLTGASAVALPVAGTQTSLDTIAWASGGPNQGKALYTSSSSGGNGVVGTITIAGGPESPTSATTSGPVALPASHGLVYDPFSDSFITMGDDEISRFSSAGVLLETLGFAGQGVNFDQGTVDGLGHIFAADNNGRLYLVDYSGGTFAGATSDSAFLANFLDDIAPKVGSGSNPPPTVPETGGTLWLMGCGFGLVFAGRRWALKRR